MKTLTITKPVRGKVEPKVDKAGIGIALCLGVIVGLILVTERGQPRESKAKLCGSL